MRVNKWFSIPTNTVISNFITTTQQQIKNFMKIETPKFLTETTHIFLNFPFQFAIAYE